MPYQVAHYRRRRPTVVGSAIAGLVSGTRIAYRNRRAIRDVAVAARNAVVAARNHVKKYRKSAAQSKRTQPRRNTMPVGMNADSQRQTVQYTSGKKMSNDQLVKKTVMAAMQRQIFYFRQYAVEATSALFNFGFDHSGVGGGTRFLPLYLFDLTARPQYQNGIVVPALGAWRAVTDTAGAGDGKIRWVSVQGIDQNGSNSLFIQSEETSALQPIQSQAQSMLSWVNIAAQMQGARNIPTTISFEIIKLLDDELDPQPTSTNVNSGSTSTAHQVYWQSEIAKLTVSPLHRYSLPKRKWVKVIASKKFTFQPKESVDFDTRGQMQVLKWFNRVNQLCNYNNIGNTVSDDNAFSSRTVVTNNNGLSVSPYCDTKDKLFLRVKAYVPIAAAGFDATIHPSFEINLRMCHSSLV